MPGFIVGFARVIAGVFSAFALFFVGVGAAEWWEHRPHDYPRISVLFFHWAPQDGLGAQLAAMTTERDAWKANVGALRTALDQQNAEIRQMSAAGEAAKAAASTAVETAIRDRQAMQARLNRLARGPVGQTACDRAQDAYKTVLETLQ